MLGRWLNSLYNLSSPKPTKFASKNLLL